MFITFVLKIVQHSQNNYSAPQSNHQQHETDTQNIITTHRCNLTHETY